MNSINSLNEQPGWFSDSAVSDTLDAREMLKAGMHPLAEVIKRTSDMAPGNIFELITPFAPMPLIEKIKANGFDSYSVAINDSEIHTYFSKI
jgi:uncharacterized protein (DUF2249 family)